MLSTRNANNVMLSPLMRASIASRTMVSKPTANCAATSLGSCVEEILNASPMNVAKADKTSSELNTSHRPSVAMRIKSFVSIGGCCMALFLLLFDDLEYRFVFRNVMDFFVVEAAEDDFVVAAVVVVVPEGCCPFRFS